MKQRLLLDQPRPGHATLRQREAFDEREDVLRRRPPLLFGHRAQLPPADLVEEFPRLDPLPDETPLQVLVHTTIIAAGAGLRDR